MKAFIEDVWSGCVICWTVVGVCLAIWLVMVLLSGAHLTFAGFLQTAVAATIGATVHGVAVGLIFALAGDRDQRKY